MPSEGVECYPQIINHMEVWFIQWNKTGFFPSYDCVSTTVWMHHRDRNRMHEEKTAWELHKNPTSCSEQIPEVASHKTAAVWPHTFHLKTHPGKMNKTCGALLEKQWWTYKQRSSMNSFRLSCQCWPTNKDLLTSVLWGHWI